jgi:hypothetical protein
MMFRRWKTILVLASFVFIAAGDTASAQTFQSLFFDDFESYNLGTLDKNDRFTTAPNAAPNGSGNPWFGPEGGSPNCVVIGPTNGVMPHSGNQMLQGWAPGDTDQDWYNLAYRLNNDATGMNGMPFAGNIALDWWFYDPSDPNDPTTPAATDYRDFVAIGFYDTAPTDRDGPDNLVTWSLNTGIAKIQRLSLGASSRVHDVGYDPTLYQARVVGTDGNIAFGWSNTSTPRSLGWHHGMIIVGPMLSDGTNDVTFYIDDMSTPTLESNSGTNFGYNVIELNADYGPATGYFDDVNFSVVMP